MKFFLLLVFVGILSAGVTARKNKKSNDWDEVDDLLKRGEDGEKRIYQDEEKPQQGTILTVIDDKKSVPVENQEGDRRNPCENFHCGWGKECVINDKGKAHCDCVKICPEIKTSDPFEKVCSNQNETFDSICHLYRERCLCRKDDIGCRDSKHQKVHIEYMGSCKELEVCTEELMAQFAVRMADWLFQVMRDLKKRQELHGDNWLRMIDEAEYDDRVKHVYPVIWKFCDLDNKPHDSSVSHHELIPITAPVMPMESCIKPFLRQCDADKDDKITLREWGKCLGLKEEEIMERC